MIPHRPTVRAWQEPLRIGLAVVWVTTLALWSYHQVLYLHCYPYSGQNGLESASRILRNAGPLWLACLLPALALGLAGYAFTHRSIPDRLSSPIHCGLERLRVAQTYATLCIAICLYLVNWRLLYFGAPASSGWSRISLPLTVFHWGAAERWPGPALLDLHLVLGALGLGAVALRAWQLVRPWPGHRRNLVLLAAGLLAAGLVVAYGGVLYEMPSPMPPGVGDLARADPVFRGMILGDPDFEPEANLALSRYFSTHDGSGRVVPWYYVQEDSLRHLALEGGEPEPARPCEICQLPGVGLWTLRGLPFILGTGPSPRDAAPSLVIELPRGLDDVRLYEPEGSGPITSQPLGELRTVRPDADWIILKADFLVPMETFLSVLEDLRVGGVRRVDLAVIPYGYRPLPGGTPRLTIGSGAKGELYEPSPSESGKRYVPPPPRSGARCPAVYTHWETSHEWALAPPDSLPDSVAIRFGKTMPYGKFVAVLQGAVAGGARAIELVAENESAAPERER